MSTDGNNTNRPDDDPGRLLRLPEVQHWTGLTRSQIYRLMPRDEFPRQVNLTEKSVGWHFADIMQWIRTRVRKQ